jgi:DNA (cytosine-5)-methyltransferase 1
LDKKYDNRRIWLEGEPLIRAGFIPGHYYSVALNVTDLSVTLTYIPDSPEARKMHKQRVIKKITPRQMKGWVKPIVDVCNADITQLFGEACKFRAQSFDGYIVFSVHPECLSRFRRENSYNKNVKAGRITKGDAFAGFGISTHAFHNGFSRAGLATSQKWVIEMEPKYLDVMAKNSPEIYKDTHLFIGKVEDVEKTLLDEVDVLGFSMPCTNHSNAGIAKKSLESAEDGDEVTALFGVVEMIKAANPAILFSENVPNAKKSFTYKVLLKELGRLGYKYKEMILDETHGGCLELRKRYWIVIYSEGLDINPDLLMPPTQPRIHKTFADTMTDNEQRKWYPIANLQKRHDKNQAEGRNFKINLIDGESTSVSTIPRSYAKHQVANPHLTDHKGQYSLLTIKEHANAKRIPHCLIGHCANRTAHEGLGQSVSYFQASGLAEQTIRAGNFNPKHTSQQHTLDLS